MAPLFPTTRLRRLRQSDTLRSLVRETAVTANDLIQPIFIEEGIDDPLPIAEMLLGKVFVLLKFMRRLEIARRKNRPRRLVRSRQMAGDPNCLTRQKRRETRKDLSIAAIAGQVRLAVNPALVDMDRRVTNPPPACTHEAVFGGLACSDVL